MDSAVAADVAPTLPARLLAPAVVAVYGASPRAGSMGERAVSHLVEGGFKGTIVPVNRRYDEIAGLRSYPSLSAFEGAVDHAMIVAPAKVVPELVTDCAENGVGLVSILAGGFAETGEEGRLLQEAVAATARSSGMRVLGPNCLGFGNALAGVCASPASIFESLTIPAGPLAVLSQSGAVAADMLVWAARVGLGVGFWISTGNELDLSLADGVWHCVAEHDISTIAIYLEGVRDVCQLERSLHAARAAGKSVILLRSGRTEAGVRAVSAHTGSLVTSARLYDALLEDVGVAQVNSLRELVETARVAAHLRPAGAADSPRAVTIVSSSGGTGAMTVDAAAASGAALSTLSDSTRQRLLELIPISSPNNPIDITGMANEHPELLDAYIGTILEDPRSGTVLFIHGAGMLWSDRGQVIAETLASLAGRYGAARLILAATVRPEARTILDGAGIPIFEDPVAAVEAMARLGRRGQVRPAEVSVAPSEGAVPDGRGRTTLDEDQALDLLDQWGVPTVDRRLAGTVEDAVAAAAELGVPVVAKLILPGVTHKTELGLVRMGLVSEDDVRAAWSGLAAVAEEHGLPTRVLVERTIPRIVGEFLVSAFSDPVLGRFVAVGAGGTLTELIDDVVVSRAPVDEDRALQLLHRLRTAGALTHHRSGLVGDAAGVAAAVAAVSRSLSPVDIAGASFEPALVEINPLLLTPEGACAVDAVVIGGETR